MVPNGVGCGEPTLWSAKQFRRSVSPALHFLQRQWSTGKPRLLDDSQLLAQACIRRVTYPGRRTLIAIFELAPTQRGQLVHCLGVLGSRISVAEVASQVETQT